LSGSPTPIPGCIRAVHCEWFFTVHREYFALIAVEIAEQATDWAISREIDIHVDLVDETCARMYPQHFTDQQFTSGPEGKRNTAPAFERERRRSQPRHLDIHRGQGRQPRRSYLAFTGGKIDRAVVHVGCQRLVHHVHNELAGATDVSCRVLWAAVGLVLKPEHNQWRVF
jgi:hypothetical protein